LNGCTGAQHTAARRGLANAEMFRPLDIPRAARLHGAQKGTTMSALPEKFENVTAICKANVYFDGKVVSHTLKFADGSRKTIGLIYPGEFKFNTGAPEKMEMIAGHCRIKLAGETAWRDVAPGAFFRVPGNSFFEIAVAAGIAEYICSFE
jgi:uncharacterized protein YaiE (UPF0345 family)